MPVRLALIVTLLQLPLVAAAQSSTLSGTWALDAAAASGQSPNGGNWQLNASTGTLTLEQKGEAVTGSWIGRLPDPWTITGTSKGASFELESEVRNLQATKDGEQTTVRRQWIFRGTLSGDTLTGTMSLAGGEGDPPTQPFTAVRKRQ